VQFYALFMIGALVLVMLYKIDSNNIDLPWPTLSTIFVIGLIVMAIYTRTSGRTEPAENQDAEK
jgi:preprotein translocase subunit SecG